MSKKNRKNSQAAVAVVETLDNVALEEGAELVATPVSDEQEVAHVDAEIADLLQGNGEEIVIVDPVVQADPDAPSVAEEVAAELANEEAKAEAYASQDAETSDPAAAPEAVAKAPKTPRVKRLSVASSNASAVILSALGSAPESYFALDVNDSTDPGFLQNTMDTVLAKVDSLDKKSREKAAGIFAAVVSGGQPSVYVRHTIAALEECGAMSMKQLVSWFMEKRQYKTGTATRQAQQMFALLPILKITNREATRGAPMELNGNSTLLHVFRNKTQASAS